MTCMLLLWQVEIKKAEPRDGSGGNKMGGNDASSAWGPPQAPMGMMQGPNGQMGGPPMNMGAPMGPNMNQGYLVSGNFILFYLHLIIFVYFRVGVLLLSNSTTRAMGLLQVPVRTRAGARHRLRKVLLLNGVTAMEDRRPSRAMDHMVSRISILRSFLEL